MYEEVIFATNISQKKEYKETPRGRFH
jgi:hypothetical protein